MKLLYFAWVRERVGKTDEEISPPAGIRTVAELMEWLAGRGEEYASRLREPQGDPRGDRPQPCPPRHGDRRGARNRILSAHDWRLKRPSPSRAARRYITPMNATIRLQREDFDAAAEAAKLTRGRTDIGAVVTFTGICRDNEAGHGVAAMTLEHYPGMAEEEIARHVLDAQIALAASRRYRDPSLRPHGAGRQYRAGGHGIGASRGGVRGRQLPDGFSQDARRRSGSSKNAPAEKTGSRRKTPTTRLRNAGGRERPRRLRNKTSVLAERAF